MADADTMSQRALNRATLARQHLLGRVDLPADTMIEHLVGMQAQNPKDPYVALWSRLAGFVPAELEALMNDRRAVRMTLYRSTIHLVTDRDALAVRPLVQPVLERMFKGSPFSKQLGAATRDELLAAGRELMDEEPRSRAELQRILGERWPDGDAESLAHAVRWLTPAVQVTPRGLWSRSGQPKLASLESWLGRSLDGGGSLDDLVLRYLGAFGPASVMDAQMWCGLTRLREVFDRLAPVLRAFRDEQGRELFDLPDAPRPEADVPAPVRFLPQYDNVLLGHADRSRFIADDPVPLFAEDQTWRGTVLVEGTLQATWRIVREKGAATMVIEQLAARNRSALEEEGGSLLAFMTADAATRDIRFTMPFSTQ